MNVAFRLFGLTALAGAFLSSSLIAQVKLPKPPDRFDVEFRYRISGGRNDRIIQFTQMMKDLKKLEFKQTVNDESDLDIFDPKAERMIGVIPSATARDLLVEPHIQTILLVPTDFKRPADEKERVKVLLELSDGFTLDRQRLYGLQIKQVLANFSFQEAVAYDHRGYTVLRGAMPWVKVPFLLRDLRGQPAGWFLPLTHEDDRPDLLKSRLPIRLIEVLPEDGAAAPVMGQTPLPPVPPDQAPHGKLSAELRRRLEIGKDGGPLRLEATLSFALSETDQSWKELIRQANPTTTVEGLLGQVVTLTATGGEQVQALARLPFVVSIRLPRAATMPAPPAPLAPKEEPKKEEPKKVQRQEIFLAQAIEKLDVLQATGLARLHAQGKRGTGLRVAIIDTDFTGFEKYVGKELPSSTHYVDLTAERNMEIQPEPSLVPMGSMGHGTHCALAVRSAAPDADIALVRVAADAPHEVVAAFRYTLGDFFQPLSFRARRDELNADAAAVRGERNQANAAYRKAFDDFTDDDEARQSKQAAKAAIALVEKKEKDLTARANRLLKLERELQTLGGTTVILNTVGWNSGQPLDATSSISRYLDGTMSVGRPNPLLNAAKQPRPSLWFQPAGDTRGQSWFGRTRSKHRDRQLE